ncbi:MAG: BTAD domain-containing putative transcriptional regulator [Bacillota bacterium]|nr:BTAD domain-containing putative transcriptional regulator [Bacillota bacterium]
MAYESQVVRTKFLPPVPRKELLKRPRLEGMFREIGTHPVTILQAGPGYGKSTSLAVYLKDHHVPSFWYTVGETDSDPHAFVVHLVWAIRTVRPAVGGRALDILGAEHDRSAWLGAVDSLANDILDEVGDESVLVIDDYHLAAKAPSVNEIVEHFVSTMPPILHVVLSTRKRPSFEALARWRVKGEVLKISEKDLAFTSDEVRDLFSGPYQYDLTPEQVRTIAEHTEGWIIALEMIWHGLRDGSTLQDLWTRPPGSLQGVFDYLAAEVLQKQDDHIKEFLCTVSLLEELEPEACNHISGRDDSVEILERLSESGLFVYSTGGGTYRFHHLLREFLRRLYRKDALRWAAANAKAAQFYAGCRRYTLAVAHLIAAGDFHGAARLLGTIAPDLIQSGRFDGLAAWIGELPGPVLEAHPDLLLRRADVYRLASGYEDALAWYSMADEIFERRGDRAGRSKALKGKAMVYLDTVQPARSDALLREAFRMLPPGDRWERASLLRMMAENKTNQGQLSTAVKYAQAAERLIHHAMEDELDIRVQLRTGRLSAALASLKRKAGEEREGLRPPRSHRETQLLLSLIYSLIGEGELATKCADAGIQLGRDLKSPFVEAVGYMRLGHARQVTSAASGPDAETCYRKALDIVDEIRVTRGRAEPLMGLALLHAASGDVAGAERSASEALEICRIAGDEWLAGFVELGMGAGLASGGDNDRARRWLEAARKTFGRCGDIYCATVCDLWLAVLAIRRRDEPALREGLEGLIRAIRTHSYEFLFTRKTLFGPRDPGVLGPLLVAARRYGLDRDHLAWLEAAMGLPEVGFHPGYTLHVRTLGPFRVYRGREEVSSREWQREKAKTLFQLLLVHRKGFLHRDQILEILWPGLDPGVASSHFKVALNAMLNTIEPGRPARLSPYYVRREGPLYGLNPVSGCWVDADEFESLVEKGTRLEAADATGACDVLRSALQLYQGDFLQDCLYEDWASVERERLFATYLRAAQRFAELLLGKDEVDECVHVCEQILARDPCWEEAYRLLMKCYLARRNRAMAVRTYERCATALHAEMGVYPAPETSRLLERARLLAAL